MRIEMGSGQVAIPYEPGVRVIKSGSSRRERKTIQLKSREELGREAWKQLHTYDGCDVAWLKQWERTIPRVGCSCNDDYSKIKKELPPDFSTPEAFFVWGVTVHNAVNRKLGKPEVSVEEARQLWRMNDDRTLGST